MKQYVDRGVGQTQVQNSRIVTSKVSKVEPLFSQQSRNIAV